MGIGLILEALKRLRGTDHPNTIYAAVTVQEEVGLRGARTSVHAVEPDIGISLEVGIAADYPGMHPADAQEAVGNGPGIFLHDGSMIPNRKFRDFIMNMAERHGIPMQPEVLRGYGEDGAEIQKYLQGVPTVNLTVPTRYVHSHNGVLSRRDFDRTADLLVLLLRALDAATVRDLKAFDYGQ